MHAVLCMLPQGEDSKETKLGKGEGKPEECLRAMPRSDVHAGGACRGVGCEGGVRAGHVSSRGSLPLRYWKLRQCYTQPPALILKKRPP